jgi:hypothetical protein
MKVEASTDGSERSVVRLHRRQFVIGPRHLAVRADWQHRALDGATHLSHCPELRAGWTHDADGVLWVLLGLAIETIEDRPDPLLAIARTPSAAVPELYTSWAGRWVLVGGGAVHMDASGLLGCFHGRRPNGEVWVSSSPAILRALVAPEDRGDPRRLRYEQGISWFPPPRSRFSGMHRLLPSQVLELRSGAIGPRRLLPPIDPSVRYDDALELVRLSLTTTLRRLARTVGQPWLGLTAGFDSRCMLSVARAAGCEVRPFTRLTPRTSAADRVLPPRLAERCGFEHVFIRPPARPADRLRLVQDHGAGHVSDGDAQPILSGVRDGMAGVSLGGHGFALASGFANWRRLPAAPPPPGEGAVAIARLCGEPLNSGARHGLEAWLCWVHASPHAQLDWRDRMFIEQRQAGWLSSKEQLYDLAKLERFPILNCARLNALLLGVDERLRLGSLIQLALMRRLAPDLLEVPLNPSDRRFALSHPVHVGRRQAARMSRRAAARLRQLFDRLNCGSAGDEGRTPPGRRGMGY